MDNKSVIVFGKDWEKEPPKEEGHYWFVGDPWSMGVTRLYYTEVFIYKNNEVAYATQGDLMQSQNGLWQKILFSEPPKGVKL